MGKDYITFSKTKVPEARYLKVLPYSINAARDVLFQEPNSSNEYMFDPVRSTDPYFKHLGYGCYDLKKLYDLSDDLIKAEENWLSIKDSNAFVPDKLLALYKYAKEFDKIEDRLYIEFYKDKEYWEGSWRDCVRLYRSTEKHFIVKYFTSDTDAEAYSEFATLKEAFTYITDLIKDNQTIFTEFRVKAGEDYYINKFCYNFTPNASRSSDNLDHTYHPYSKLRDEEKSVIKAASEELTKEGFFLNAYYFQYVHEEVQGRLSKRNDVRRSVETERILARTQKEAEDIFYKEYPKSKKINCAAWETFKPISFQNKADIEDCKRKIEMYKEKLKELKKETPKDLVKVEIGFEEC